MTSPDAVSVRGRVNTRRVVGLTAAVVSGLAVALSAGTVPVNGPELRRRLHG